LRVLLGVTGGIAAYKAAELVRRLREHGHEVRCALTRSGEAFLPALTLEVLSGHPVYREEYLTATGSGEEAHIAAAAWADLLLIAPATSNTLSRLALGLADDFLATVALAFDGPVVAAPAMHSVMWAKPALQGHVEALEGRGVRLVGPVSGPLASGEVGLGRMADPAEIVAAVEGAARRGAWAGRTVLVTAGPTWEPIDPVRFVGNRSSGKMGFALAAAAARLGARVELVAGPVALSTPRGVVRTDVTTALEMEAAVAERAPAADLVVMAAAVADYRPKEPAAQKIKKSAGGLPVLELIQNPDILAQLPAWAPQAVRVGFAAETHDVRQNALAKLATKGAHFLVANDVSRHDIAFGSDANEVTVYRRSGEPVAFSRRPKEELAADLLALFAEELPAIPEGLS
jgi:phosphopantothenoylcysteine decarboxylase/phosphopantothenate--cysteine ligase